MNLLWIKLILINLNIIFINCECPDNCVCSANEVKLIKSMTCINSFPKTMPFYINELLITKGRKPTLDIADTKEFGQLKTLHLIYLLIENITDGTFQVNNLLNLSILRLSHNNIRHITSRTFLGLENLEELYLDNNNMRLIDSGAFMMLKNLKILDLQRNYIEEIPKPLPYMLKILWLNDNNIETIGLLTENLTNLRELNLCGNKYKSILNKDIGQAFNLQIFCLGDDIINIHPQVFALMPQLKSLSIIGKNNPTPQTFQGLPFLTQLETVSINYVPVTKIDMNFGSWKTLKYFHFKNIKKLVYINEEVFESFGKTLELLDSSGSTMFTNSLFTKDLLKFLVNLKILNLANTGIVTIPDIKRKWLPNLQILDISKNPLMCDCKLQWIINTKEKHGLEIEYMDETKCAKPNKLSGEILFSSKVTYSIYTTNKTVMNQSNDDLLIQDNLTTEKSFLLQEIKINILTSFVIILSILVVLLIAIIIILIKCRHKNTNFKS